MPDEQPLFYYSPSSIVNLFNNALNVAETKRIIRMKGVYSTGKGQSYNGNFYDVLKDESTEAYMTLVVPGPVRQNLINGKVIEFLGYINKKLAAGGRIELQAHVAELVSQTQGKYSEADIEKFELQQAKALKGYRDVDGLLKRKLIEGEKPKVSIIMGKAGIIDGDIMHQLEEAVVAYDIQIIRVNLSSEDEIINEIYKINDNTTDVIVISRGGGDNLDLFNRLNLAKRCINLTPLFVTAIGHRDDVTLLQKIADKSFITPTAFGQYLNDLYNETKMMLEGSKAKLVEDITKNLAAGFKKQVQNLNEELISVKKLNSENLDNIRKVNAELVNQKDTSIRQANELATTYKADAEKAKKLVQPSSNYQGVLIIIVIIAVILLAVKTCGK